MKRILLVCLVMLSFLGHQAWAQSRTVTGTVTSAEDGMGMPGVNVSLKGTSTGTLTGIEGDYTLKVPEEGGTLVFSFVGLKTLEIAIGNQSVIDVAMENDVKQLSEVVVTALGISREQKSLGYAVQEVGGEELTQAKETNVVNSLSGKVAGVQISGSTNMGGSARILIRGASSVTGNNEPLFVVDGVPVDNSNFSSSTQQSGGGGYDYGNAAQDINPEDIESMSVLKGASATALYGSRAANGVIVITTKKGKSAKGLGVSVNSAVNFQDIMKLPNYQNAYGGGLGTFIDRTEDGLYVPNYAIDESWGPKLQGQKIIDFLGEEDTWDAQPDNIKQFFNTGTILNNNVAISGGNDKATFRLSYTNMNQTGVLPNSSMERNTINFSGSTKLTDKWSTSVNGNFVSSGAVGRPGTGYSGTNVMQQFNQWSHRQLDMQKMKDNYKNDDGSQNSWNVTRDYKPKYADNPYWTRYENFQNDSRQRIFGNVSTSYQFTDALSITGQLSTDYYTDRREERIADGSVAISMYEEVVREVQETNANFLLSYNKTFGDVSLSGNAGGNTMYSVYSMNAGETQGGLSVPGTYNLKNSVDPVLNSDRMTEKKINSLYGNASVGYKGMLFVDGAVRGDWSSTLPADQNFFLYPSVSSSFVFSELGALATSDVLSFGKVRVGWASVGNDTDPYRLATVYNAHANYGSNPNYSVPNSQNNPALKPERTSEFEAGLELRFLMDRVGLNVSYYDRTTNDLITPVLISGASGYTSKLMNAGIMRNHGVELMLTATPIKLENGFQWDATVNLARNRNEVKELAEGLDNLLMGRLFSASVNARPGEAYGALMGYNYEFDANGNKIIDPDGYYVRSEGDEVLGNVVADWTGGLNNSFSFKGFSLSALINFQKGGDIFSLTNYWGKYSGMMEETTVDNIRENGVIAKGVVAQVDEDGKVIRDDKGNVLVQTDADGNPVLNEVAIPASDYFQGMYGLHASSVYDASFIKLKELRFGYTLPNKFVERLKVKDVNISITGRNLGILYSNVPHIDPENTISSGNIQGLEGGQLPSLRSYGFNLSFKL
jgi:TonB-linked SusC/RagA family outer membrane protein